ncbi:TetR/AcrR family transcriptional regulator [Phenylobacterium sp.]|uniref:TetR/AcrR family transcriptional regulator n=1 Tax=Phenylobacterium sp. TaxID=1871053 RepID=UPI00273352BA|nr:TetR/AcrR family transcriptional regulator [Phenylobacterium sp.]MDP3853313.1 TetR/AcrR family transcriptional regulator [Phenylobacterium sp.]
MKASIPLEREEPGREPGRSERKRAAILDAATEIFLRHGYLGASMDEVAAQAEVSKQTVYKQFESKEALFVEIVGGMTGAAGDKVQREIADLGEQDDPEKQLLAYAERQLTVVLTPRLMQLRRLVIGEANRFPALGRALYDGGPGRSVAGLAAAFARWTERGLLGIEDPRAAASHFNWLVMGEPVNSAMLLGDESIPEPEALRRHAVDSVRVFLAAYGSRAPSA